MSFIKRHLEKEETANDLVEALEALLENERVENPASEGISKKIISDRSVENLSEKQLSVFENYIQPLLEPECEGHCGSNINMFDLPNALLSEFEEGGLYCQHCIFDRQKMNND